MRPITAWQDIEVIIKGKYNIISPRGEEMTYNEFTNSSLHAILYIIELGTWQYKFE